MGTLNGIKFIDVCYPEYLTDHHNRDGECLIGVRVSKSGRLPERSAEMFVSEVNGGDWGIPEDISDEDLRSSFLACIGDWRLNDSNAPGHRSQDILCAWFVIQWSEVEAELYDPESEQQAYAMELTLSELSETREEWGDNF